uniref:Uncharacterized protein n=1 Tax=Cucumis melo TaxID=3656 RepID=A0A9I9E9P4_CUCME
MSFNVGFQKADGVDGDPTAIWLSKLKDQNFQTISSLKLPHPLTRTSTSKFKVCRLKRVMLKMERERVIWMFFLKFQKPSSSICLKKFSWNLQEKLRTMTLEMWPTIDHYPLFL